MNPFKAHNKVPLTCIIDVTTHKIYLFQKDGTVKHILDRLFPYSEIAVAELIDVQINEIGNNVVQMYQFVGDINDERVPGLESVLNYTNDNFLASRSCYK